MGRAMRLPPAAPAERPRRSSAPGEVGVGSTKAQVSARVHDIRRLNESGPRHCFVGKFVPGRTVTDFRTRKGRVNAVSVGFVID